MVTFYAEALLAWRTIPAEHFIGKYFHAALQTVALVFMSLGVRHAFDYSNAEGLGNLETVHGWLGIMTISLFCTNYMVRMGPPLSLCAPRAGSGVVPTSQRPQPASSPSLYFSLS